VNLNDLKRVLDLKNRFSDPELKHEFDDAVRHLLGTGKSTRRKRNFAYYGVVGFLLLFGVVTAIVNVLAMLKLIDVNEGYLSRSWTACMIDLVALGIWLVKAEFTKEE
jgi:hypothetical protein